MSDILVVTSKVKAIVKEKGLRTSAEFVTALSERVEKMTQEAIAKVAGTERKTVLPEDLS